MRLMSVWVGCRTTMVTTAMTLAVASATASLATVMTPMPSKFDTSFKYAETRLRDFVASLCEADMCLNGEVREDSGRYDGWVSLASRVLEGLERDPRT